MASRRKSRILAFQSLYAWDASRPEERQKEVFPLISEDKQNTMDESVLLFANTLVKGTLDRISEIDKCIQVHLKNWAFERVNRVDLALLRLSVYCLVFQQDIPANVTIDEAIEIAKEYGTEDSFRFVNGVLNGVLSTIRLG